MIYDVFTTAYEPNGYRRGYVPATLHLPEDHGWDMERLLNFMLGEANLCRREIYMGGHATVQIKAHRDARVFVTYKITGGYVRGFIWEVCNEGK